MFTIIYMENELQKTCKKDFKDIPTAIEFAKSNNLKNYSVVPKNYQINNLAKDIFDTTAEG